MIGIYQDNFVDYLKDNLGEHIKITSKNIIVPCPFCEYNIEKKHYHLYLALDAPIWHCFHCEKGGLLPKLLKKIEGSDISEKFVDKKLFDNIQDRIKFKQVDIKPIDIQLPKIANGIFPNKELYVKKRLKFSKTNISSFKGLIFDVYEFIRLNDLPVDPSLFRMKDFLQTNFVGFLTENKCTAIFRNIDYASPFRYYKIKLQDSYFLDYYRLPGIDRNSKKIVLAEGIFDILTEQTFDSLKLKSSVKLYATALSSKYNALIKSIMFHEQVFRPEVIILSDRGIGLDSYKQLRFYNRHIIDSLTVYYNKNGKDFNDLPILPDKYIIRLEKKYGRGYAQR